MTPIGPFRSPYFSTVWYIVKTLKGVYAVADGSQPESGLLNRNVQEARAWLKDAGFELVKS